MVVSTNHTILSSCKFLVTKMVWIHEFSLQRLCSNDKMLEALALARANAGQMRVVQAVCWKGAERPQARFRWWDEGKHESIMKETEAFEKKHNIHCFGACRSGRTLSTMWKWIGQCWSNPKSESAKGSWWVCSIFNHWLVGHKTTLTKCFCWRIGIGQCACHELWRAES